MKLISNHELQQRSRERIVDTVPQSVRSAGVHQSRIARAPERFRFAGKHQQGTRFRHERAPAVRGRGRCISGSDPVRPPRAVPFQGDGGQGLSIKSIGLGWRPMLPLFA